MNRLFRVLAAAALTLPLLVSCGGAPSPGLNLQGEGTSTSSYRIIPAAGRACNGGRPGVPVSCSKVASFTGEPLFVSEAPAAVRIDPATSTRSC